MCVLTNITLVQTEFTEKYSHLPVPNKSTISQFLTRFHDSVCNKKKLRNLLTEEQLEDHNLRLLQSPKNHRDKTCIANGYVLFCAAY